MRGVGVQGGNAAGCVGRTLQQGPQLPQVDAPAPVLVEPQERYSAHVNLLRCQRQGLVHGRCGRVGGGRRVALLLSSTPADVPYCVAGASTLLRLGVSSRSRASRSLPHSGRVPDEASALLPPCSPAAAPAGGSQVGSGYRVLLAEDGRPSVSPYSCGRGAAPLPMSGDALGPAQRASSFPTNILVRPHAERPPLPGSARALTRSGPAQLLGVRGPDLGHFSKKMAALSTEQDPVTVYVAPPWPGATRQPRLTRSTLPAAGRHPRSHYRPTRTGRASTLQWFWFH